MGPPPQQDQGHCCREGQGDSQTETDVGIHIVAAALSRHWDNLQLKTSHLGCTSAWTEGGAAGMLKLGDRDYGQRQPKTA